MTGTNESLSPYESSRLGRSIGPDDRAKVREVMKRVLDELEDSGSTRDMFRPYGTVVNFILANRQIAQELAQSGGS